MSGPVIVLGVAAEDIRAGAVVEIEVDPGTGYATIRPSASGMRRVSAEGVDDPVASVTLHGVDDGGWQRPWVAGDRYVWTGTGDDPLVFVGEFVHHGPGEFVTVRHDGDDRTSQVYAAQLLPEADRG